MMRNCYEELEASNVPVRQALAPEPKPLADWSQRFKHHSTILLEECMKGSWRHWLLLFILNDEAPGIGEPHDGRSHVFFDHMVASFECLAKELCTHLTNSEHSRAQMMQHLSTWHRHPLNPLVKRVVDIPQVCSPGLERKMEKPRSSACWTRCTRRRPFATIAYRLTIRTGRSTAWKKRC